MKKVIAFGNPLLDTTIFVNDNLLLKKHNLKEDGQREINKDEMQSISRDISGFEQHHSAGGCAQNSLRVLQWLSKKTCEATIFGSVGKDNEAAVLKNLLENDGVQTRYVEQDSLPTGKTIALVNGPYRSLVAYLGAAEYFSLDQLLDIENFPTLIKESDFVYIEGFYLTNRTKTARYVLDFCNEHNKIIIFNISGEYVCNICPDTVKYFVENSDIVFGNEREFEALVKIMDVKNIQQLTDTLIRNGRNKMKDYGNIIVITDGAKPGTCIYEGGKTDHFNIPLIDKHDIKDTTGAGDAFTGGFIAGLCNNKSVVDCAQIGCYSAFHIIQQTGCTLPSFQPNVIN